MSILIFFGVLFILVLVHELGHFAVAKWMGMRVDEFGIGFPPRLFSIRKGETVYSFNALPIGGFVKIFGEDGEGAPSARLDADFSEHGEGKSQSSGQSRSDRVAPPSGSFVSKSRWAQAAVLIAGVAMNILFAWLLIALVYMVGVQGIVSPEEASPSARLAVTQVIEGSPAADAGVPVGSVIESVVIQNESLPDATSEGFSTFVGSHNGEPVTILFTHKGELRTVQLIPEQQVIPTEPDRYAIGMSVAQIDTIYRSVREAVRDSFFYVLRGLRDIAVGIGVMLVQTVKLEADLTQVAGPVGIVSLVGEASAFGFTTLCMFTAFISLNLAVINILPFPALDGGRLLIVMIEGIMKRNINAKFVTTLNTIGFVLLMLFMITVTWSDIAKIVG
jgi:regulator of sigma E protease